MPFVIDVSAMMPWTNADEDHPHAAAALERARTDAILAPALWWFELRNALVSSERRRRTTPERIGAFLHGVENFNITIDRSANSDAILRLARAHRLTVYDAAYLELAAGERADLATLDGELIRAARREHVALVGEPT